MLGLAPVAAGHGQDRQQHHRVMFHAVSSGGVSGFGSGQEGFSLFGSSWAGGGGGVCGSCGQEKALSPHSDSGMGGPKRAAAAPRPRPSPRASPESTAPP